MTTERVPDAIQKLRDGKRQLRGARARMSLPEKVRQVMLLQRATYPLLKKRRALRSWERPWPYVSGESEK
jgi:hypothetical protein